MVFKKILENPGKSVSSAMLEVGYSPAHAKNPQDLTNSKSWKELLEEYLPDALLANIHAGTLEAGEIKSRDFDPTITDEEIKDVIESVKDYSVKKIIHLKDKEGKPRVSRAYYVEPDPYARNKALAEAYKIKAKYTPEEHTVTHKLSKSDLERIIDD